MKKIIFVFYSFLIVGIHSAFAVNPVTISLRIEPAYVSPNKDGVHDQIFFYPVLPSNFKLSHWRLDIKNSNGHRVQRLTGAGVSALIKWDVRDKKEQLLLDGSYFAQLEVWASAGHFLSIGQPFFVDTVAPEVNLQTSTTVISSINEGRVTLTPLITDNIAIDRWQIQILNQLGKTVSVEWSTETAHPISWNGKDSKTGIGLPPGEYTAILQAWDKAGNGSANAEVTVKVESSPSQSLRQVLKRISIYETYIGLIAPIPSQNLFLKNRNQMMISPNGEAILTAVALLVNAYPDHAIRLDGYSSGMRKGDKNRDMSSVYAWTVYSHLVKKENVKASRISVRGRGKSPMFDRRAVQPDVVSDGIEIILEGTPPW